MTGPTCCGLILVVALYVGVAHAFPAVVHTVEPGADGVFPQVCRVVMPEDLDRGGG